MTSPPSRCRFCDASGPAQRSTAREMMYGSRATFDYDECSACGSVQIAEVPSPEELAEHYPQEYYAFTGGRRRPRLKAWADDQRTRHLLGHRNLVGRARARQQPDPVLPSLAEAGLDRDDRILDVGCGDGALLNQLARVGFTRLSGVDPFVPADTTTPAGVPVAATDVHAVRGEHDVVMFNHSLEHVPDPLADLQAARSLLAPRGRVLVRLPTTSSEAYETYGVDWVQLDPPRHLAIPSRPGMQQLAERAGLRLTRTIDDSSAFQFLWSELYRQDVAMLDPAAAEAVAALPPGRVEEFSRRASELNALGRGDQALFVLEPAGG